MKYYILALALSVFFCACSANRSEVIELEIAPHLALSYGSEFKSLTIKSKTGKYSPDHIKDFAFEWGYHYKLSVQRTDLENPPQDASSVEYQLLEVLSKTKAEPDYQFSLRLEGLRGLGEPVRSSFVEINKRNYRYMDAINLVVSDSLHSDFLEIVNYSSNCIGQFKFGDKDGEIQLLELGECEKN